jgi:type I restriction enzyme S subunit
MRDGWIETTLGEISALQMGRTPSRRESSYWTEDLTYPFCTIADMDSKYVEPKREGVTKAAIEDGKAKVARKGTLLMSFKLTIGRMGFAARDIFPNEAIVMIEADESKVLNHYLYLRLASMDLTEGSGRAVKGSTLNSASIASISFLVPPLTEQKRIVDLISSVDSYIESLQQQLESVKRSRNAVLHELLTADGEDWLRAGLSEICTMIRRGQAPSYTEQKSVTVLNQKCVRNGRIQFEFARQTDPNIKPINEWAFLTADDTLVNSTGVGTLGRVAFVGTHDEPLTVDSHLTIVRPDKNKIQPSFLGLSLHFREADIEGLAAGSSGQTELSREALGNLIITIPPLPEQTRIVEIIASLDKVASQTQLSIAEARNLRSGLLTDLLSGEHEIPASYDKVIGAA